MIDAPSALAMVLMSSSGSGSAHATRFATPGLPLNRVGESCGISASFASSAVSAPPCSASATALTGSFQIAAPFSISVAPDLAHHLHHAGDRLQQLRERIVGSLAPIARVRGEKRHRRRAVRRGVGHRHHHPHERDAVRVAVMDAHDQRAAAREILDQVKLPQRPRRIERPAREPAHQRLQLLRSRAAGQRHRRGRGRRSRNPARFPSTRRRAAAPAAAGSAETAGSARG